MKFLGKYKVFAHKGKNCVLTVGCHNFYNQKTFDTFWGNKWITKRMNIPTILRKDFVFFFHKIYSKSKQIFLSDYSESLKLLEGKKIYFGHFPCFGFRFISFTYF